MFETMYSLWDDGVEKFGFDDVDGDIREFILARDTNNYELRREEDDSEEIGLRETKFKLFRPDEITVEKLEGMEESGWEFVDVTVEDAAKMLDREFYPE